MPVRFFRKNAIKQIGSTHHDAEVHLVHLRRDSETHLLVLGVLIDAAEYGDNKQVQHCPVVHSSLYQITSQVYNAAIFFADGVF